MAITEEQRQKRRKYLGSSDAAAIVGCSPYASAYDVWLQKTYQTVSGSESEACKIGNVLEPAILDWAASELGVEIQKDPPMKVHANGIMASHPDALIHNSTEILEAKTAGILYQYLPEWGEIETDEIPEQYLIQCQHHMAVHGPKFKICHVPVLMGGVGLRMYHIERDDELIESLESLEKKFWQENVLEKVEPDGVLPNFEIIKRIKRSPNKTVPIDSNLLVSWNQAKEVLKEAKKKAEEAKALVLAALGDAEAGECELGTLTYLEQTRKSYTVEEATFRVPRFKKNKGDKNAK